MNVRLKKRPSEELIERLHSMKHLRGKIALIEPETGEFFVADRAVEALREARRRFPNTVFYAIRIGSPVLHWHKGGLKGK